MSDANGDSPLRRRMEQAGAQYGLSLQALTVLAKQNDPFRLDTPGNHAIGEWLAMTAARLGLGTRVIHLRGLHYMILGVPKPDGTPYANTDKDWKWLGDYAADAARWLGYLPFEQVADNRNTAPVTRIFERSRHQHWIESGLDVEVPELSEILPTVHGSGFQAEQPYKIVLYGEKSSLEPILSGVADRFEADLYLPAGEISETQVHTMARIGAEDGRPMRVFSFCDCDPSGWQMPVSIARKLQGHQAREFPDLDFQVRRVGLTPDQVRGYGLPSTPLKEGERRAEKWSDAMGVEQTEVDALAALQPDLFSQLATEAIAPFHDASLQRRVTRAYRDWQQAAQAVVDAARDDAVLDQVARRLAKVDRHVEAINDALAVDAEDFDLPPHEVPGPELDQDVIDGLGEPLIDSRDPFAEQCLNLIRSKDYQR